MMVVASVMVMGVDNGDGDGGDGDDSYHLLGCVGLGS